MDESLILSQSFQAKSKQYIYVKAIINKVGIYRIVLCHLWKQVIYHKRRNVF